MFLDPVYLMAVVTVALFLLVLGVGAIMLRMLKVLDNIDKDILRINKIIRMIRRNDVIVSSDGRVENQPTMPVLYNTKDRL